MEHLAPSLRVGLKLMVLHMQAIRAQIAQVRECEELMHQHVTIIYRSLATIQKRPQMVNRTLSSCLLLAQIQTDSGTA